ncbi:MAG: hypothetical protein QXE23_08800 [Nitrososphaerota archaeon]
MESFDLDGVEIECHICGRRVKASELEDHLKAHTAIELKTPFFSKTGKCVMAVFGRIIVVAKIVGHEPMNPWRVYAIDTHGRPTMMDLRRAFIVTQISEEEFRAKGRRRKRSKATAEPHAGETPRQEPKPGAEPPFNVDTTDAESEGTRFGDRLGH